MDNRQKTVILDTLRGKAKNKMPIFGFDVETSHEYDTYKGKKYLRQEFVMGSVVGKSVDKVFWDRKEMQDYILSRATRGGMIAATNLEFDFNILFRDRLKDFFLVYNNRLLAAIHTKKENKFKRKWTLTDTINYLPTSLSVLGNIVGLPKLPTPEVFGKHDKWGYICRQPETRKERIELERYNLNDSRITYLFMEHFRRFCTDHRMKLKLTIASTGMDFWRRNYQPYPMFREPVDILKKHFLGSFRGGRVEVYKRGTYNEKLWYYDYRSSYPGVMVEGSDGSGSYPDPSSWHHCQNPHTDMIEKYEGICQADIKAPYTEIPPLGVRVNSKLLFPVGTFSGWFTNHELKVCMNNGYEVEPNNMIYYSRTFKPFKEAVKYLYKLRKKYKLEQHVYEKMVKLLMNSGLFGKWGMNWQNMEELIPMERVSFDEKGRCIIDGTIAYDYSLSNTAYGFDSFLTRKKAGNPPRYSFPILSSYTTMLGRMKLWQDIRKKHKHLVYADTDSAVMTRPVLTTGDELGDWELEHKSNGGIFIRPKLYMLRDRDKIIAKAKGFRNIAFNKNTGMNDEDTFISSITFGKIGMSRFTRMKESRRMGINSGSVMHMVKHLGLEDDKRVWEKEFSLNDWQDSIPLTLRDGLTPVMQRKAMESYHKSEKKNIKKFLKSDLFDSESVGDDITQEEYLENEKWFAMHE